MKKIGLTILLVVGSCLAAMAQNQTTGDSDKNYGQQLVESIKMVYVEGGEFMMGATSEQGGYVKAEETPAHKVKLSSFYISQYEITLAQYQAINSSRDETNPRGATTNSYRVVRGGSWGSSARNDCRVSSRSVLNDYDSENYVGFRVVCLP